MKTALITGGAKRIGAELATRLVKEGFRVAVHYNSSRNDAEQLKETLNAHGDFCEIFSANLEDRDELTAMFNQAQEWLGQISLCVNNASLFVNDDIVDVKSQSFDAHLNVNLKAPVYLSELMFANCDGLDDCLIVNMLDNKVFALNPDFFTYTISKTALHAATHMMAMRFDGFPRVCGIAPSITLISGKQTPENFEKSSRINPLGRQVKPAEIADTLMFMWNAKSYNDQIMNIDGGQSMMQLSRDVAFLVKEGLIDE